MTTATTPAPATIRDALTLALDDARDRFGRDSAPFPLPDGRMVSVRMEGDCDDSMISDICDGEIASVPARTLRPKRFDGRARKVANERHHDTWYQPASDVPDEAIAARVERLTAYYRNEWSYLALGVTVSSVPCACCAERKAGETQWIGGIESDSSLDDMAETLEDFIA